MSTPVTPPMALCRTIAEIFSYLSPLRVLPQLYADAGIQTESTETETSTNVGGPNVNQSPESPSRSASRSKQCTHPCPHCKDLYKDAKVGPRTDPLKRTRSSSSRGSKSPSPGPVRGARIQKRWDRAPKRITRCKGLKNPGTLCYQNAVLQCLLNMPEFVGYLDNLHVPELPCLAGEKKKCVVCALKSLLKAYADPARTGNIDAERDTLERAMKATIPSDHPMAQDVKRNLQSDPWPFLRYLYEEMQDCEEDATEGHLKLDDLLSFTFATKWTCEKCNHVTIQNDVRAAPGSGFGLSLNTTEPETNMRILDYLHYSEFTREMTVRCEDGACQEKEGETEGSKRIETKTITKAPEILPIQLLRFNQRYNPVTKRADEVKVTDPVGFDEYLNLIDFTDNAQPIVYQLQGVVGHAGSRPSGGHYIAAVRAPTGRRFWTINDSKVSQQHEGTARECTRMKLGKTKFDPYVLFYTQV